MENAIEVHGLQKRYGQIVAVDGLTFNVTSGEIFGLLGPNGAGKTTTVECLLGLRTVDTGEIRLLGMMHADHSRAIRARLGVQLQSTGLLPQLTVREQVQFFADLFPHALPVDEVIARVGLTETAKTFTRALSGGQKQRLAVALALINDPDLLFLDEPTTGLDPQARRALWDLVRGLQQAGKTVLLTTHYMEEAEQLCDRVAIVDHGRIIELGTPMALIRKYFHETAIEFTAQSNSPRESLMALPAVSQTRLENGQITLYSTDVPRTMAALFELASASALVFHDMSVRQATLEDVFLKLTGRRIRA
jgi:ABC-2 type transport system ATP-binding protein